MLESIPMIFSKLQGNLLRDAITFNHPTSIINQENIHRHAHSQSLRKFLIESQFFQLMLIYLQFIETVHAPPFKVYTYT